MCMYLNRSNDSFKTDLEGIFVDKSDLISILNKRINTKNRFICITRARRFGKTVNANMIDVYYSRRKYKCKIVKIVKENNEIIFSN